MNDTQNRQVQCGDRVITYSLTRKKVKNVNLRVKLTGEVCVSASRRVSCKYIDDFILEKQGMIFGALDKFAQMRKDMEEQSRERVAYSKEETRRVLHAMCEKVYPKFVPYGIAYPQIQIRTMKTKWGSCQPTKGVITLNSRLMEAPEKCIEYVVVHEFSHFIHPNHSKQFYEFVERIMPDWKQCREELKKIY